MLRPRLAEQPLGQLLGFLPLSGPVVLVHALGLEPVGPRRVAVPVGEQPRLRVELGRTPQVAEVRLHAPEVEVAPDALGRARADGDLDASLQVGQPLAVPPRRPGDAHGVQYLRSKLVELQLLGDLHRSTRELDRRLGLVGGGLEPGQRAERVRLRVATPGGPRVVRRRRSFARMPARADRCARATPRR